MGLYHLSLQNNNSWLLDFHSSNPHHLSGKRSKSRAYSGWRRFNILFPTYLRVTNQFAFADRISQKYDVGEDDSPAKLPERALREFYHP